MTQIVDLGLSSAWLEPNALWPSWLSHEWIAANNAVLLCQLEKGDDLRPLKSLAPYAAHMLAYPSYPVLGSNLTTKQLERLKALFLQCLGGTEVQEVTPGQRQPGRPERLQRHSIIEDDTRKSLAFIAGAAHAKVVLPGTSSSPDILSVLAEFYEITLVMDTPGDIPKNAGFQHDIISHREFLETGMRFDRVLYELNNDSRGYDVLSLLQIHNGVVILNDAFLGDCILGNFVEMSDVELMQSIYRSHGWAAVKACQSSMTHAQETYPACGDVLLPSLAALVPSKKVIESLSIHFDPESVSNIHAIPLEDSLEPSDAGKKYHELIESVYLSSNRSEVNTLCSSLISSLSNSLPPQQLRACCDALDDWMSCGGATPRQVIGRQLLVDISAVVKHDLKTGIQRTVRNILRELMLGDYAGLRVEPIYYDFECEVFRYARDFTADFFELRPLYLADDKVDARAGDVYLNPDLFYVVAGAETPRQHLQHWRGRGVGIYNVVYDLLPLLLPHCFPEEQVPLFDSWIRGVTDISDAVICISKAVASEYQYWVREQDLPLPPVGYFHLGADLEANTQHAELTPDDNEILGKIQSPYLLMVGTVEPRKGHLLTLNAFEELWARGVELSLVVVGATGWIDDNAKRQIANLQQHQPRFHYLRFVNDSILDALYQNAASTLMASEGEGFGLPIIEAAFRGSPLLLSDLPVFREICGDRARYFTARDPVGMADQVEEWLSEYHSGSLPSSTGIQWNSWKDSTDQLMRCVLEQEWLAAGD